MGHIRHKIQEPNNIKYYTKESTTSLDKHICTTHHFSSHITILLQAIERRVLHNHDDADIDQGI